MHEQVGGQVKYTCQEIFRKLKKFHLRQMHEQVGGQGAEERGRSNAAITKTTNTPSFLHLHYLDDDYDGHDVDDEHHQNHQNPLLFAPAW